MCRVGRGWGGGGKGVKREWGGSGMGEEIEVERTKEPNSL